ncbi:unnamed protein product [Prorocentrum cordatum]|uniref:Uncharacterized protein n=1 Tax=Prorocentrum cordatum TaxID=2364126 RepID=A0ABN9TQ52_9DINO|nr:unnamed protein product [Polarella glacialis]
MDSVVEGDMFVDGYWIRGRSPGRQVRGEAGPRDGVRRRLGIGARAGQDGRHRWVGGDIGEVATAMVTTMISTTATDGVDTVNGSTVSSGTLVVDGAVPFGTVVEVGSVSSATGARGRYNVVLYGGVGRVARDSMAWCRLAGIQSGSPLAPNVHAADRVPLRRASPAKTARCRGGAGAGAGAERLPAGGEAQGLVGKITDSEPSGSPRPRRPRAPGMLAWLAPCCCQEQPSGSGQVVLPSATDEGGSDAVAVAPPYVAQGLPAGGSELFGSSGGAARGRICVGDFVRVTSDEQALRRAFESSPKRWDDSLRSAAGTRQRVLAVGEDGALVGLREEAAGSGEPVRYYPAGCLSVEARPQEPPRLDNKPDDSSARWGEARTTAPTDSTSGGDAADMVDDEPEHQDLPGDPGPGSARSLTEEEKIREKLRLQSLVNGFARRAVKGCPCMYLKAIGGDPEKYEAVATQYRIDRSLENLVVVLAGDPNLADVTCPIAAIQDIYSLREDDEDCFPRAVVSSLQPQDRDLLLMVVFQRQDKTLKFCILEESAEARDEFLETLHTLHLRADVPCGMTELPHSSRGHARGHPLQWESPVAPAGADDVPRFPMFPVIPPAGAYDVSRFSIELPPACASTRSAILVPRVLCLLRLLFFSFFLFVLSSVGHGSDSRSLRAFGESRRRAALLLPLSVCPAVCPSGGAGWSPQLQPSGCGLGPASASIPVGR